MIDYELRKLNFPPLDDNFMKFVLSEFSKLSQQYTSPPAIKSKFMLDNCPKIPMLPQQEENSSSAPQSVEIIRVKRSRTVPLEQKIDSTDCRIISKDADIYDIDTGGLIASFRKGSVRQSAIEGINKYAFNVTLELLQTAGAQSKSNTFHLDAKNKKKTVPQSAPFGILGLLQQNVTLTNLTTSYPYNIETISYLGEAIEDLEKVYQRVAPEEFSYCETAMSPL